MFFATAVLSSLLAAMLAYAALRKLSHEPDVVAAYARVGVPEDRLNLLAALLLAGAAGLIAGLFWGAIGVASAAALVGYFACAVVAHVRFDDVANLPMPLLIETLALATLVLHLSAL